MFRKNTTGQVIHFQGVDAATGGIKSGVTWTVRRCIDGTFAAGGGTVTEDGTTGWYKYAMSQADTNGNNIGFNFTGTGAVPQTVNIVTTAADPTDGVRLGLTALPNAAAEAAGGLYTRGTGAGQINQPANGQVDANAVKLGGTTQTGRDIGASVLLSSGSGAGQLDFTSGIVKSNLSQILGTALTETAGQIAAAFKKFFDKASPTGTINSIPDAVAGASGGLALVGSNVGTAASVSGAVGSVTADVGITQAGADKVWSSATRTLSSFGSLVADIATAVWGATTRLLTAGTNIVLAKGTGVTGFNDLSAAQVNAEVDTALADYDGPTHAELTSELATADDAVLAVLGTPAGASLSADIAAVKTDTEAIGDIPTASDIALAVRTNLLGKPANIVFLDPGGAATESGHVWDGSHTSFPTVDTTIKPAEAYSSLKFATGQEIEVLVLERYRRISLYFRLDALPSSGNEPFLEISDYQDFVIAFITVTSSGKLSWSDPTSVSVVEGKTIIAVDTWYRIAVAYDGHGVADNLELKIYLDGMEEVSVVGGSTNGIPFTGGGISDRLRPFNDVSGRNVWLSHIYVDDGEDLGDPGNIRVTAKLPTTVNVDDFDTTGGTGAINERPLSETNYRQQAGTSQVRQNYNIQAASVGDVDISKAQILGYMGWAWVKRSSGFAGSAPRFTVNGKDYPVSLSTSPTIKRQMLTDTAYPADAAAIGLVSTGSSLDTYLYECGIVIAYTDPLLPTIPQIADAVWDEDIVADHTTADTAGKKLSQALILYEGS